MSFIVFTMLVVVAGALLDRWTQRDANRPVVAPPEAIGTTGLIAATTARKEAR